MLGIEESYDALIQNFVELEKHLLVVALEDMIYGDTSWSEYQDLRVVYARLLKNLLSSCRAYFDHTARNLSSLPDGGEPLLTLFAERCSAAFDRSFAYRFMESLRNHAQHFGLPIHGAMFDAKRIQKDTGDLYRYAAGANIDIKALAKNPKFKKAILEEAADKGEKLDVFSLTREYVEEICLVHLAVRRRSQELLVAQRDAVELEFAAWGEASNQIGHLYAFASRRDLNRGEGLTIFFEPFDRLDKLRLRNRELHNLRYRYVSNELIPR